MPGMSFMLTVPISNHEIHLGIRDGRKITRALSRDKKRVRTLELPPAHIFGQDENDEK